MNPIMEGKIRAAQILFFVAAVVMGIGFILNWWYT